MISVIESFAQAENESRNENIRMGLAMIAVNGTSGLYSESCSATKRTRMMSL